MIYLAIISLLVFVISLLLLKNYNYSEEHEKFYLFLSGSSLISFLFILIAQL